MQQIQQALADVARREGAEVEVRQLRAGDDEVARQRVERGGAASDRLADMQAQRGGVVLPGVEQDGVRRLPGGGRGCGDGVYGSASEKEKTSAASLKSRSVMDARPMSQVHI